MDRMKALAAVSAMQQRVDEMRGEIGQLAAAGDVFACDLLHGDISVLEAAMAIMDRAEGDR